MNRDEHGRKADFDVLKGFWVVFGGRMVVVQASDHLGCPDGDLDDVGGGAERG